MALKNLYIPICFPTEIFSGETTRFSPTIARPPEKVHPIPAFADNPDYPLQNDFDRLEEEYLNWTFS